MVKKLRTELQEFIKYVPLITALRNPGLKDRHWNSISRIVGANVKADDSFSLSLAISMGCVTHLAAVAEVSESASKEYTLEKAVDKMQVPAPLYCSICPACICTWLAWPAFDAVLASICPGGTQSMTKSV